MKIGVGSIVTRPSQIGSHQTHRQRTCKHSLDAVNKQSTLQPDSARGRTPVTPHKLHPGDRCDKKKTKLLIGIEERHEVISTTQLPQSLGRVKETLQVYLPVAFL